MMQRQANGVSEIDMEQRMTETESQRLKLMVVDDEADNLELLYRTFRRDFDVFPAESGFKALEILAQEGEMAIIISDQRMPKMNGTEFLSRTVEKFPDTIRILLTGYTDVEDLVGAINAGKVFKYITKPWNPDHLMNIVLQAADTYHVVKQRTNELQRSLRRESLFNTVMNVIRESLDYRSMLQTVVETIGQAFAADSCILRPVERTNSDEHLPYQFSVEAFSYPSVNAVYESTGSSVISSSTSNGTIGNGSTFTDKPYYPSVPSLNSLFLQATLNKLEVQLLELPESDPPHSELIVPLAYQQELQAILVLYRQGNVQPWSPEEIELISGVAEQTALAISQAKLYRRIQDQTEQMRSELAVARQIQSNLLRQSWPELPNARVQAYCYPAREVGGDFFEVFVHPQGDIWLAVGDVSGKGVPAALFMASAISLLRRELSQETPPEPHVVMSNLNQSLSDDLVSSNCFITMVLARYNPTTRELVYANAGHVYPLVWSRQFALAGVGAGAATSGGSGATGATAPSEVEPNCLKVRGVPLGILAKWQAPSDRLILKPTEVLLLTSDGITEANVATTQVGAITTTAMLRQSGLWQLLSQEQGALNLDKLLSHIQAQAQIQEDDQTILALEVL